MRLSRLAVVLLAVAVAAPVAQPEPVALPADTGLVNHPGTGGIRIIPGAGQTVDPYLHFTRSPAVTVSVPSPADASSRLRLSNDGATWLERVYAASVPWDLTDPAAGGTPGDGYKTVWVEYGDGTTWHTAGEAWMTLDRVAPTWADFALEGGAESVASWRPVPHTDPYDESGNVGARASLDGARWTPWGESYLDIRSLDYGGSWALGPRTIWYQARDAAGNVGAPVSDSINIVEPPPGPNDPGPVRVRFEFPRPAVMGSLFTVRPIYPQGYVLPTNAWCGWRLHWGDDESIYGNPNEHFGEIVFERKASLGGCGEWTFTLPYNAGRRFNIFFNLMTKTPAQEPHWGYGTFLYENIGRIMEFTAGLGTTDRSIHQSTIPVVYVLPETTMSQLGDYVTYRLHASGGQPVPGTGQFFASPLNCYLNPSFSQNGGSTFTYKPICAGNWVTGWIGTYKGGFFRSQYDPVVDGKAPTVTAPTTRLRSGSVVVDAPVDVAWSGTDTQSGIYGYELQRSLNGGTWRTLALRTRSAKSAATTMPLTGTTRFRVRARDRVGNMSAWVYGPVLRGAMYQDTSTYLKWRGTWSTSSSADWYAGSGRMTSAASASSRFTFSGRGIAWVARTGPTQGLARVFVDGALVATVDLRSSTWGYRSVRFARAWTSSGTHTIEVRNNGTAGTPGANVDGFVVVH